MDASCLRCRIHNLDMAMFNCGVDRSLYELLDQAYEFRSYSPIEKIGLFSCSICSD